MANAEWKPRRLDELGFVGRGKSRHRPRNEARLYDGPYPFVQTADVMAADPYITSYSQTYSEFGFRQSKMWPAGTLCMTIAGANTAKTAILKIEACFPDSIVGFIPDKSKSDLHFVKYSLDLMRDRFLSVSRGATQDNLSLDKLLSFPIPAPDVDEQRRIGAILSCYDDLIENNTRRIKILEEMAQALYREWFVHFRFPGYDKIQFIDSQLGKIPEGSEVKKLGDLVSYNRRATKPGPHLDARKYVPVDCLPSKSLALLEAKPIEEAKSSLQLFEIGDILFGAMRPYFHKVVVAPFAGVTRTTCFVFKSARPDWHAFATMTAFEETTVAYANAHSQGATIPYAVWDGSLSEMPLVIPPNSLLCRFEKIVAPMLAQLTQAYMTFNNLRRTRDLLLPKLISGEIDC